MGKKVLITGGAGFIGSYTADRLLEEGYEVRLFDSLDPKIHPHGKPAYVSGDMELTVGDVRDREALRSTLQGVNAIIHLAAYQDYLPDFSTFFSTNAVSTAMLYELIVEDKLPIEKVIIASSQFVQGEGLYRNSRGEIVSPDFRTREQLERGDWEHRDQWGEIMEWIPTPETHFVPPNAYALSKASQEQQGIVFGKRYDIPTVVMRYSIVQGSRHSFYNAYSGACRIFSLSYYFERAPTIYEDGKQVRDFVNIHDVVDANLLVMNDDRANYRVFCVGGGRPCTILEFDRIVAREFGLEHLEPSIPMLYRYGDTRHAVSDISALEALGWSPKRTVVDSVSEYAFYLRSQKGLKDIIGEVENQMKGMNVLGRATKDKRD